MPGPHALWLHGAQLLDAMLLGGSLRAPKRPPPSSTPPSPPRTKQPRTKQRMGRVRIGPEFQVSQLPPCDSAVDDDGARRHAMLVPLTEEELLRAAYTERQQLQTRRARFARWASSVAMRSLYAKAVKAKAKALEPSSTHLLAQVLDALAAPADRLEVVLQRIEEGCACAAGVRCTSLAEFDVEALLAQLDAGS